ASLQAALARTLTRTVALYFSRPVRLFRPAKVSGWHTLRSLANHNGASLTPQYIYSLIKSDGFMVIPKHFVPPIMVNAVLGSVLWTVYAEASTALEPHMGGHPTATAMAAGAIAGGAQAVVAAPAENVRIVIEGGSVGHSWSNAWKEVFRGTTSTPSASKRENMEEMRQVRSWMREVGEMAGRGWDGWGWGFAKDVCGYAVFFAIFEVTRRVSLWAKDCAQKISRWQDHDEPPNRVVPRHFPRTVHALTLVTGGMFAGYAYEVVCRPWDAARRTLELDRITNPGHSSPSAALLRIVRQEGFSPFFRSESSTDHSVHSRAYGRGFSGAMKTLGRLGPWGVGFLVWEIYGPGL
ncbi:hypothetical protein FISHEDRAFT_19685, partial [Fistulina hepatica ATCC 64428]